MNIEAISRLQAVFQKQKLKSLQLRTQPIADRKAKLKKLLQWIIDNRTNIQQAIYTDFKKPPAEVDLTETYIVFSEIRFAIKKLDKWSRPKKVNTPIAFIGTWSEIRYEPKGVCLIIAPWNYPFQLAVVPLVSAIAAGNCVTVKPSELTPATSALIKKMAVELFNEEEVYVFEGDKEISEQLLLLPFDHIFFTGSPSVGKIVMKAAAENLTSVTLELGGKSPVIIDKNVNIKDAAIKIAVGKFLNCGQTCVAPDYVLVHETRKEEFVTALKTALERFFNSEKRGFENSADYARMVNEKHWKRVVSLIQQSKGLGATFHCEAALNEKDKFISPVILSDIKMKSPLMQEEIFGPVLPIITYTDCNEALQLINSKPKPLALYVFSNNKKFIDLILQSTSSGGACINECDLHFMQHELPFGGVNHSGIGKAHGYYGFLAFSNEKGVLKQRTGFTGISLFYPPFTNRVNNLINILLKWF